MTLPSTFAHDLALAMATFAVNALWQVPLCAAAGLIAARMLQRHPAIWTYRVWVAVVLLQLLLPALATAAAVLPVEKVWYLLTLLHTQRGGSADAAITVIQGPVSVLYAVDLAPWLVQTTAWIFGASFLFFSLRFLFDLLQTHRLLRRARTDPAPTVSPELLAAWQACRTAIGTPEAQLLLSTRVRTPQALGLRRGVVLLPLGLAEQLSPADLRAALAHECAHIRRGDYARNLLYECASLPVRWHPLALLSRSRLHESREWVCDYLAAASVATGPRYARSLLRLAALLIERDRPARLTLTLGTLHADAPLFERRLMRLTQPFASVPKLRATTMAAACISLALLTCGSAWALRTGLVADSQQTASSPAVPVKGGVMAGFVASRVNPVYPPDARAAHLQGSVVLHAVISETGAIQQLNVVSGPPELASAALDAVKQWTYKPYELNGKPTAVETTITVNFQLNP